MFISGVTITIILPTQRFVPDLPWQPIPVHTVPVPEDTVRLCMSIHFEMQNNTLSFLD